MKITNVRANSWSSLVAWIVGGLFIVGFFVDPIGTWTGPILGAWFVGTQRVWRGFLWMLAFAFIPSILMEWRFADSSFDVVFHVGGISFFNDKGKAIREMIRVAKPGSLLLIEDETEDYAKSTYEGIPITSAYFKDRKEQITVPINLVPAEMEDIRLEMLKDGKFFAIAFRKPVERVGVKAAS